MSKVKKHSFWLVIISLLAVVGVCSFIYIKKVKEPIWDSTRTIRYGFILKNTSSKALKNVVLKTYSPLVLNSNQKLVDISSSNKFTKHKDKFQNQEIWFDVDFIPPYGKKQISITAKLLLSSVIAGAANDDKTFITKQNQIESDDTRIVQLSHSFKGDPHSAKFQKSIYDWQIDNLFYTGYGYKDKGALYALLNLEGDCTEFAYLNVALNRALGVPSRAVNGYVVDHDAKLNASEYHTWSEVWIDGGWQMIDAQKKQFMNSQQDYIAMNIVVDKSKNEKFKRYWVSNQNLTVTMK